MIDLFFFVRSPQVLCEAMRRGNSVSKTQAFPNEEQGLEHQVSPEIGRHDDPECLPHYKPKKLPPPKKKFPHFLSPIINMDPFYSVLPFSQMALPFETEEGDEVMLESDIQDSHSNAAEDDQQQVNYPSLWEELWTGLDSGIMSEEEVDALVVLVDHELMLRRRIPDDELQAYWETLPNEVSWEPVWLEQMEQNNGRSEDDENDTRAWHDRHRRWWHPPRYVVFCATRSNDRTGLTH